MKKLTKILFLLANSSIFYTTCMEVRPAKKSLYEFFEVKQFNRLDKELKDWIAQQYYSQWWYNLTTISEHSMSIHSVTFNHQSDKLLISGYDKINFLLIEDQHIAKLFDLQGNLLATFIPGYTNASKTLWKFDHTGEYLVSACQALYSEDIVLRLYNLNINLTSNFQVNGSLLALEFNPKGEIVLVTTSQGTITVQLYDINLNKLRTIEKQGPSEKICFLAELNKDANELLLQFKSTKFPRFLMQNQNIEQNDCMIMKWRFYADEVSFVCQHKKAFSSMAFSSEEDKVLTDFSNKICLFEFSPNGRLRLTVSSFLCRTAKLWDFDGNNLVNFSHPELIICMAFNSQSDMIIIGSVNQTKIWALYKNPTLEQLLLRKLINRYLRTKKPYQQITSPEILFKDIVSNFKTENCELDEQELIFIWYSIPEIVRNSFWNSILKFIKKFEE